MKRQRQPNFSPQEKEMLLSLIEKYESKIENKKTDGATVQEKNKAWSLVTQQFNAQTPNYLMRSEEALRIFDKNMKKDLRKKTADHKKEVYLTGGGPEPSVFSEEDNKLLSIVSKKTVFGLKNSYDSDAHPCSDATDHDKSEEDSVNNIENINEKAEWKNYKVSDLQKPVSTALKSKVDNCLLQNLNADNIEIIYNSDDNTKKFKTDVPQPESSTEFGKNESHSTRRVHSSRRRPISTITTLTSSAVAQKYDILADKKLELVECLKKEHEARMASLKLDIEIKKKQLDSM